ncbi:glycoside hydrolase family protein [Desulfovulcanus sp.]
MNIQKTKELLILHEGKRNKPYTCPAGKLTIGVGRNLEDVGLRDEEIEYLLDNDIKECVADLKRIFPDFDEIDDARQAVLIDMRFNLGPGGFRSFKNFIRAVRNKHWDLAVHEMRDSIWYKQVGQRAVRLCNMMESGNWDAPITNNQ